MRQRIISILGWLTLAALLLAGNGGGAELPRSDESVMAFKRSYGRVMQRLNAQGLTFGSPLFIRIFKETKELEVWLESEDDRYKLFRTYTICHHSGGLGPKVKEGDRQSPEGFYRVDATGMNPWSNYHLAFNLGYPNDYDRAHQRTGGELMIHGRCSSVGCFAMTDYYMDELYTLADGALASGQRSFPVHIFPFRLTNANVARHTHSPWKSFWKELQPGYRFFEKFRMVPRVHVRDDRYILTSPATGNLVHRGTTLPGPARAVVGLKRQD
jgi:murein L,D-transpeptidase YafK